MTYKQFIGTETPIKEIINEGVEYVVFKCHDYEVYPSMHHAFNKVGKIKDVYKYKCVTRTPINKKEYGSVYGSYRWAMNWFKDKQPS